MWTCISFVIDIHQSPQSSRKRICSNIIRFVNVILRHNDCHIAAPKPSHFHIELVVFGTPDVQPGIPKDPKKFAKWGVSRIQYRADYQYPFCPSCSHQSRHHPMQPFLAAPAQRVSYSWACPALETLSSSPEIDAAILASTAAKAALSGATRLDFGLKNG